MSLYVFDAVPMSRLAGAVLVGLCLLALATILLGGYVADLLKRVSRDWGRWPK